MIIYIRSPPVIQGLQDFIRSHLRISWGTNSYTRRLDQFIRSLNPGQTNRTIKYFTRYD